MAAGATRVRRRRRAARDRPASGRQPRRSTPTGSLYVTYSGTRGQQAPVSIFRVAPGGAREPFVAGIVNATSMAFGPTASSTCRAASTARLSRASTTATPRGDRDRSRRGVRPGVRAGRHAVRRRSIGHDLPRSTGRAGDQRWRRCRPSVAAFHLAMGPTTRSYVTGPTLATLRPRLPRRSPTGTVETLDDGFGRPQGLAFDADGMLHVVEALAGASGVYRLPRLPARPELVVVGRAAGRPRVRCRRRARRRLERHRVIVVRKPTAEPWPCRRLS